MLIDIYSLNEQETDTVRLDASTIKQLYEETDYKLDDIRKNKLVKPVALTLLPNEIKKIEIDLEDIILLLLIWKLVASIQIIMQYLKLPLL